MAHAKSVLLLAACLGFGLLPSLAGDGKGNQGNEDWERLVRTVQDIILGRNIDHAKSMIAPDAELVYEATRENLYDVVAGRSKTCSLVEDSTRAPVSVRLKMNDAEDSTLVVLQTGPETDAISHTVVFLKDSVGQWKIESWHTNKK